MKILLGCIKQELEQKMMDTLNFIIFCFNVSVTKWLILNIRFVYFYFLKARLDSKGKFLLHVSVTYYCKDLQQSVWSASLKWRTPIFRPPYTLKAYRRLWGNVRNVKRVGCCMLSDDDSQLNAPAVHFKCPRMHGSLPAAVSPYSLYL